VAIVLYNCVMQSWCSGMPGLECPVRGGARARAAPPQSTHPTRHLALCPAVTLQTALWASATGGCCCTFWRWRSEARWMWGARWRMLSLRRRASASWAAMRCGPRCAARRQAFAAAFIQQLMPSTWQPAPYSAPCYSPHHQWTAVHAAYSQEVDRAAHRALSEELKHLYTAITRAKNSVCVGNTPVTCLPMMCPFVLVPVM
jgi:hypothetical protein